MGTRRNRIMAVDDRKKMATNNLHGLWRGMTARASPDRGVSATVAKSFFFCVCWKTRLHFSFMACVVCIQREFFFLQRNLGRTGRVAGREMEGRKAGGTP